MGSRAPAFDVALRGLILLLVVGTPLALGTVTARTLAAFHWLTVVLGLLWVLRAAWVRPVLPPASGRSASLTLLGHPLARTGLGLPAALFVLLVLLQLTPLPHGAVKILSPATARLHAGSLPGLAGEGRVDFASTGSFLLGEGHDAVIGRLLEAPGDLPAGLGEPPSAWRPVSLYPYATVSRLFLLLSLIVVFAVSLHVFSTTRRIHRLLRVLVFFGFLMALFGIVQRLSWNGRIFWSIPVDSAASPFGPFINHNHFAAFLAMIVPVAMGMLMDEARRLVPGARRLLVSQGPEPAARLLLAAFAVGVMAAAVVLSASRGAVLALLGALVLYGAALAARGTMGRPETLVAAALIVAALGLSFWVGVGPLAEKLRAIGDVESEPSLFTRLLGYRATMEIIGRFPLLGTGVGTFPQAWKSAYPPGTAAVWHEAHNDYLQILAEAGGAGFVIFLAALWIFSRRYLIPTILEGGGGEVSSYALHGVVVGLVAAALHSLVDFPLQIAGCAVLFVVLSAVVISWRRQVEVAT